MKTIKELTTQKLRDELDRRRDELPKPLIFDDDEIVKLELNLIRQACADYFTCLADEEATWEDAEEVRVELIDAIVKRLYGESAIDWMDQW